MKQLTARELEILIHLTQAERDGFCGDRGYEELSAILGKLKNLLQESSAQQDE